VGALLRRGRNHLAVTLATSLRNTLGPHHLDGGESHWVGPRSFVGATGWFGHGSANSGAYRDAYNVVDFGLSGGALLRY
jgi:hypothetical protein